MMLMKFETTFENHPAANVAHFLHSSMRFRDHFLLIAPRESLMLFPLRFASLMLHN